MFSSLLITQLGWRYALLANCGITLFLFICGFLLKPIEVNTEEFEDGISIYTDNSEVASSTLESVENLKNVSLLDQLCDSLRLFQNVSFSLFCINNVLFFGALTILWVHLNGYILKSGYSSSEAGWIYSIIGISNVCGRVFLGVLCDHKRVNPVVIFTIGNFFLALNELYASYAQSYQGKFILLNLKNLMKFNLFSCDCDKCDIWFCVCGRRTSIAIHNNRVPRSRKSGYGIWFSSYFRGCGVLRRASFSRYIIQYLT